MLSSIPVCVCVYALPCLKICTIIGKKAAIINAYNSVDKF